MDPTTTTYARARLRLGMTGVGLLVTLAVVAWATGAPARGLPTTPRPFEVELRALAMVFGLYALLQLPLDLLGGWILPRRHGRAVAEPSRGVLRWLRGVATQGVVVVGSGLAMLAVARAYGEVAAIAAAGGLMLVLVALQATLARVVGDFGRALPAPSGVEASLQTALGRRVPVRLWEAEDEGFTGGWFGLPGAESLVLPARWAERMGADELTAAALHRAGALATGARTRGLLLAIAFNLLGLALASRLPGAGFGSVAALVTTALFATVWSFVGLLVLPSVSRPAVLAADAFARRRGVASGTLARVIRRLDRWQDDEPSRTPVVETIFHPVPSVERRLAAIETGTAPSGGAWHTARMMLFLSWSGLGLLARAVHCNAGRPQLWVALPAD